MNSLKFSHKLILIFGLMLLVYVLGSILTNIFTQRKAFEQVYHREMENITEAIYQTANTYYLLTQEMVNNNLNVADHFVAGRTTLDNTSKVEMTIENQITAEKKNIVIPSMHVKNNIGMEERVTRNNQLVDYITDKIGGTVTIFQLIDDGLLRISTSVIKKQDSTRAIGTYIPTGSPVYKTIINGETYKGRAYVVDDYYITAYKPIYENEKIIGAIYVGIKQTDLTILRDELQKFKLGETFYPYIINTQGEIVIHPFIDEGNLLNVKDLDGKFFIRDIIKAIKDEKKHTGEITYNWMHENSNEKIERMIFYKYLPQMHWVIAVGIEKDEIYALLKDQIGINILAAIALFIIVFTFLIFLGNTFSKQLNSLTQTVESYAKKDFSSRAGIKSSDELGTLAKTFNKMADQLQNLYNELDTKVKERTAELYLKNNELWKQKQEAISQKIEIQKINEELETLNDAYRDSEEKVRRMIENLKDEYIFYSQLPSGEYQYISPSVEIVLGYSVQEASKGLNRYFTEHEMNEKARELISRAFKGKQQTPFKVELYAKNGWRKIFEITETPIVENGKITAIEGIAKDITAYIKTQESLVIEKEFAELVLRVIPSSVFTVDKNKKITSWNKKAAEITGYSAKEIIGNTCKLFALEPCNQNCGYLDEKIKKPITNRECTIKTKSGEIRTIIKNVDLLYDINGKNIGGIESFEDITGRKIAENKLQYANMELRDQKEELQVALNNLKEAQLQLVQSEKMAALGQLIAGIAHEINTPLGAINASSGNLQDSLNKAIESLPVLIRKMARDGIALFIKLLKLVDRDLHELNSKEKRQLKREIAKKLETCDIEDPQYFADSIIYMKIYKKADELIPLLTSPNASFILQYARTIVSLQKNTKNIALAVDKASKVVFALKKFVHRDQTEAKTETNINDSIETVLTLYYNQIKKGVEVVKAYDENLPLVPCISDEINQVWSNIIQNAIHAMNNNGKLLIKTGIEGQYARISVSDDGCGMTEDVRKRIFEPFYTTKPQGEGSGLGLDIVKKIIDKHDGKIYAKSEKNVGTTFIILLPLK